MRDCIICDEGVLGVEIHFLYECRKLDDLRTKYISSCNRMSANVYNFTRMLQNSEPDKINNLAKLILCDLKGKQSQCLDHMGLTELIKSNNFQQQSYF